MIRKVLAISLLVATCGCTATVPLTSQDRPTIDPVRLLDDLRVLSSPALEGRETGTPGNALAREYFRERLSEAGARPFDGEWLQPFAVRDAILAYNVIGFIPGSERSDRYILVTAHYDHLGVRDGQIYHGADDNASGTAALLEIARHFAADPPENSIVFAALDAEEMGLRGARTFVADPPVPLDAIVLNINLDMVSRSEVGQLYVAGGYHYPFLVPILQAVGNRSDLQLLPGHDDPALPPADDWTMQSDHGIFHEAGIPFVYFGVEDHPDYHQPSDTFDKVPPAFFGEAVRTILDFAREADRRLDEIEAATPP